MKLAASYLIGLLFGTGIVISGMYNPAKVLNFFDIAGTWDPSLMFVMGGALITTFFGYRWVFKRVTPVLDRKFSLPENKKIDMRLLAGSATFGIGWGIAGFCPGGALPALGTGRWEVFVFTGAVIAGILFAKWLQSAVAPRDGAPA